MELEEISIERFDEGELVLKEENKFVLSKGAWSTVMYLYRERQRDGEFGELKVRLVRYQKRQGRYMQHSRFNITGVKQVKQLMEKLTEWFPD